MLILPRRRQFVKGYRGGLEVAGILAFRKIIVNALFHFIVHREIDVDDLIILPRLLISLRFLCLIKEIHITHVIKVLTFAVAFLYKQAYTHSCFFRQANLSYIF